MIAAFDIKVFYNEPQLLSKNTIPDLKNALIKYPYYQPLHYLLLKNLLLIQSPEFGEQLNRSIIHISDRSKLFHFLYLSQNISDTEDSTNLRRSEKESMQENISDVLRIQLQQKMQPVFEEEIILPNIDFEFDASENILKYSEKDDEPVFDTNFNRTSIGFNNQKFSEVPEIKLIEELETEDLTKNTEFSEITPIFTDRKEAECPEIEAINPEEIVERTRKSYFDINELAGDDFKIEPNESDLIANFISQNPRLEPKIDIVQPSSDITESGTREHEDFMTESMAKIYIKQGNFEKALLIYDKLSLKYPEKNSYFAARVEEINNLKKTQ